MSRNSFEYLSIIGRGGFGKVWKVYNKKYHSYFAMKEMSKAKIIDKKSEKSVKSERELLSKINHPFLINMHFSFQDNNHLYLVMDLLTGGDLRYHICKNKKFSETQSKFFICCIILGLEYCHKNRIIHRDIKPENLVLDSQGYVHITDFGIAKIQQENNYKETSGTPGYMSPEVMMGQNHTIAVDYFALGVIGFEFMKGYRPYLGKNRKEIKEQMMLKQAKINEHDIEKGWSFDSSDFINRLLKRKAKDRLGFYGPEQVKEHSWIKNFNWGDLYNKKIKAPFKPEGEENFDYKYCNAVEKQGLNTKERYADIVLSDNYKEIFLDYLYFNRFIKSNLCKQFDNIHEKMYKKHYKMRENKFYSLNVENNYVDYNKKEHYRNKSMCNIENNKYIKKDVNNNKKHNLIHVRSTSTLNGGPNQAFLEANLYLQGRKKLKRNLSVMNNIEAKNKNEKKSNNNILVFKLNKNGMYVNNKINNNHQSNHQGSTNNMTNSLSSNNVNSNFNNKVNMRDIIKVN